MTVIIQSSYGYKYEFNCSYFTIDPEKGYVFQVRDREPEYLDRERIVGFEVVDH